MSGWPKPEPDLSPIPPVGWLLVGLRAPILAVTVFGGLAVLLLLRLFERPLCAPHRPVTPYVTQGVCRAALAILGIGFHRRGTRLTGQGALVANHASWLDIFVLNAADRIYFVSKSEVADWPGIGWLARATGTLFIRRDRRESASQRDVMTDRLTARHRLLFFPEGTSTDGLRVLPFKTTLFAPFFGDVLRPHVSVQPVTVTYVAPPGRRASFYGWWGAMDFSPHLLRVMAVRSQGRVDVVFHPPLAVADFTDRKALARAAEVAVRSARPAGLD